MIEPTVFLKSRPSKESQRVESAFARLALSDPTVFRCDAKRSQAKASRRNARNVAMILIQS